MGTGRHKERPHGALRPRPEGQKHSGHRTAPSARQPLGTAALPLPDSARRILTPAKIMVRLEGNTCLHCRFSHILLPAGTGAGHPSEIPARYESRHQPSATHHHNELQGDAMPRVGTAVTFTALIKVHADLISHRKWESTAVPLLLYLWNLDIVLSVRVFTYNSLPHKDLWKYSKAKRDPCRRKHFQTTTILISPLCGLPLQEKIYAKIFKCRLLEIQDQVKYLGKTLIITLFSMLWQSHFSVSIQSLTTSSRIITHANVCKWGVRTNPICGFGITFCPFISTTNWENREWNNTMN